MSENNNRNYWAIIPASGIGRRMQSKIPKQYLTIGDKTILEHTILKFLDMSLFKKIVVVLHPKDNFNKNIQLLQDSRIILTKGGDKRYLSVFWGLKKLESIAHSNDFIAIHDAVRPCIETIDIQRVVNEVNNHTDGVILGIPVQDTIKKINTSNQILTTIDRQNLWQAQTPQIFQLKKIITAFNTIKQTENNITDEASAMEIAGYHLKIIEGNQSNIKITTPIDLMLSSIILKQQLDKK